MNSKNLSQNTSSNETAVSLNDTAVKAKRKTGRGVVSRHTHPKRSLWKRFYVSSLFILLPTLLKIGTLTSKGIRDESEYLGNAFSFTLAITGYPKSVCIKRHKTTWKKIPANTTTTYTITFRDLDYAYDVFCGSTTLKNALAARLFSTHGPNNLGVSLTYLFTIVLKTFFFWRSAYHK